MDVSSHADSIGEFSCAGSIFSVKLLGLRNKATKLLLTEFVGQCRNIRCPKKVHKFKITYFCSENRQITKLCVIC